MDLGFASLILAGVLVVFLTFGVVKSMQQRRARGLMRTPRPGATAPAAGTTAVTAGWSWSWSSIPQPSGTTVYILAALLFLEFVLWYTGVFPQLFTWPGILHIPIYMLAVIIFSGLEEHVKGRRYFLAVLAMVIALSLFGISHLPGGLERAGAWLSGNTTSSQASGVPTSCIGMTRSPLQVRADTSPLPDCQFHFTVTRGVMVLQDEQRRIARVEPDMPVRWPPGWSKAKRIWAEPSAVVEAAFCPLHAPRWSNGCTS